MTIPVGDDTEVKFIREWIIDDEALLHFLHTTSGEAWKNPRYKNKEFCQTCGKPQKELKK